jgi:hypothetical protein
MPEVPEEPGKSDSTIEDLGTGYQIDGHFFIADVDTFTRLLQDWRFNGEGRFIVPMGRDGNTIDPSVIGREFGGEIQELMDALDSSTKFALIVKWILHEGNGTFRDMISEILLTQSEILVGKGK